MGHPRIDESASRIRIALRMDENFHSSSMYRFTLSSNSPIEFRNVGLILHLVVQGSRRIQQDGAK